MPNALNTSFLKGILFLELGAAFAFVFFFGKRKERSNPSNLDSQKAKDSCVSNSVNCFEFEMYDLYELCSFVLVLFKMALY